jgi:hypothetical protein
MRTFFHGSLLTSALVLAAATAAADPPPPTGGHPRIFLTPAVLTALTNNAKTPGTAAASLVKSCQDAIDKPQQYTMRGGADGGVWPLTALACTFAWKVTQDAKYLAPALTYLNAALNDDQTIGDNLGCVSGANANWQSWQRGSTPAPPAILTITHDTDYPMRWYGPSVALIYDWLHDAPGVDDGLRSHIRFCLTNWVDYYTAKGYHNNEPGSNYNAGFVVAKTLTAIALAGEAGATGDAYWTSTIQDIFRKALIGTTLAGAGGAVGTPAGSMLGGDWAEGWQYGPLSIAEYSAATRALEEQGVSLPEMDAWVNSLLIRYIYALVPKGDQIFVGGDTDASGPNITPAAVLLDAVLLGPATDDVAAWATKLKKQAGSTGTYIWDALAETRVATPKNFVDQNPSTWYLARGLRNLYVRSSWDPSAFWAVFSSAPNLTPDHQHFNASSFVLTRGSDDLIVDPSPYGSRSTLNSNAVTANSTVVIGSYAPSQTPWSQAELLWARAGKSGVTAARSDFAKAFNYSSTPSDIPYARREWVFLPEGEIVAIDRVQTGDSSRKMFINFHLNTASTPTSTNGVVQATIGSSSVAVHLVAPAGAPAMVSAPPSSCSGPAGSCTDGRFPTQNYALAVPGPYAVAIHVIDGLGANEALADVASLNDTRVDPTHQNGGVIGAAVTRSGKANFVVASSAQNGAAPGTMTYATPGDAAARHIVFDAPENGNGQSVVHASAQSGSCAISITGGAGFTGHPLLFTVAPASSSCTVSEDAEVPPAGSPGGGGIPQSTPNKNQGVSGGCGCDVANRAPIAIPVIFALLVALRLARATRARK